MCFQVVGSTLAREAKKPGTVPRDSAAHYDTCEATGLPHILAKIIGALRSNQASSCNLLSAMHIHLTDSQYQVPDDALLSLAADLKSIIPLSGREEL